jgi:hypothetical protein
MANDEGEMLDAEDWRSAGGEFSADVADGGRWLRQQRDWAPWANTLEVTRRAACGSLN